MPSTIDGYRMANVYTLGPVGLHISQSSDLNRLLSTGIVPKVPGIFQSGTFLLYLTELKKAPFEPMKDTDLKHITLDTAFLLALASGKHCSEIHACIANKVSNLGQEEKVALFPSSEKVLRVCLH